MTLRRKCTFVEGNVLDDRIARPITPEHAYVGWRDPLSLDKYDQFSFKIELEIMTIFDKDGETLGSITFETIKGK